MLMRNNNKPIFKTLRRFVIFLSLVGGWTGSSMAQEKEKKPVILEEVVIKGEVEKPEAYFILQRKSFDYLLNVETQPKFDATELIVSAVESDVF